MRVLAHLGVVDDNSSVCKKVDFSEAEVELEELLVSMMASPWSLCESNRVARVSRIYLARDFQDLAAEAPEEVLRTKLVRAGGYDVDFWPVLPDTVQVEARQDIIDHYAGISMPDGMYIPYGKRSGSNWWVRIGTSSPDGIVTDVVELHGVSSLASGRYMCKDVSSRDGTTGGLYVMSQEQGVPSVLIEVEKSSPVGEARCRAYIMQTCDSKGWFRLASSPKDLEDALESVVNVKVLGKARSLKEARWSPMTPRVVGHARVLSGATVETMKQWCRSLGIKGASNKTQSELHEILCEHVAVNPPKLPKSWTEKPLVDAQRLGLTLASLPTTTHVGEESDIEEVARALYVAMKSSGGCVYDPNEEAVPARGVQALQQGFSMLLADPPDALGILSKAD